MPLRDYAHIQKALAIPGVVIPEWVKQRLKIADNREEGVNIATEIIKKIRDIEGINGVHIRPIGGGQEKISEIVTRSGLNLENKVSAAI